ncbi:MAG: glutamate 5-kinase [Candidatus Omnitrophica bacterium]|nr:glutamate 5-kinase [Candidatus Omnitrophota bacterium]
MENNKKKDHICVVKIGSSVLAKDSGGIDEDRIKDIAEQVGAVRKKGLAVILVSSGAIAAGIKILKLGARPESLPDVQACAAIGQAEMMKKYEEAFRRVDLLVAQVLLTQDDINDRERYLNARNTLFALLAQDIVIPIINENDTVSTEEIKFGDNDRLSSLVASLIGADKLIIMSDVDGLYKIDRKDKTKKSVMRRVDAITDEIESLVIDEASKFGVGGMASKLQAAKIVTNAGIECVILNGKKKNILLDYFSGEEVGTVFVSKQPRIGARKRWIAYSLKPAGTVKVDNGAKEVLIKKNRSLLASGIIGTSGKFGAGDAVGITDEHNTEFARGIANYSSSDINKIMGTNTKDIEKILGYKYKDEVIHRDDLVILEKV